MYRFEAKVDACSKAWGHGGNKELAVLVAFYNDVRDSLTNGTPTCLVCAFYTEKYPEYKNEIEAQYMQDCLDGFPGEESLPAEVLSADTFTELEYTAIEIEGIVENKPIKGLTKRLDNLLDAINACDTCERSLAAK